METEYGTRNINVRWDPPTIHFNSLTDTLRGSVDNLTYYVRVGEQEIATNETEVNLTSADGLLPGTQYTIQVCTYVYCGIGVHAFISGSHLSATVDSCVSLIMISNEYA